MYDFSSYIGIPFASKGRDCTGLDCWGLVRLVYKEKLNIDLPSYVDEYVDATESKSVANAMDTYSSTWLKVDYGKEKKFDVIIMSIRGLPIHVGVVVKFRYMLHVLDKLQTCIERYDTPIWSKRIKGFYRYA